MALTSEQNIPNKPVTHEPWTFRRLLGGGVTAISTAFTKVFASAFEWLLAFSVIIIATGELTNAKLSYFFYVFASVLLVYLIVRNIANSMPEELSKSIQDKKEKK